MLTYKDVSQELYCLKSCVTDFDLTGQIVWPAAVALSKYSKPTRLIDIHKFL